MKKLLLSCLLLLQAACLPVSVSGELSACPPQGLSGLTFFDGNPSAGEVIAPESGDGKTTWTFRKDADIYVACHYPGYDRVQRLPQQMRSCTFSGAGAVSCKSSI